MSRPFSYLYLLEEPTHENYKILNVSKHSLQPDVNKEIPKPIPVFLQNLARFHGAEDAELFKLKETKELRPRTFMEELAKHSGRLENFAEPISVFTTLYDAINIQPGRSLSNSSAHYTYQLPQLPPLKPETFVVVLYFSGTAAPLMCLECRERRKSEQADHPKKTDKSCSH
jgi:hypothetical protein